MQAIIMAAGKGNRIADVHDGLPKSFLQVGGKRIIDHQLDCLETVGVSDITMVVGYRKECFEQDYAQRGIRFAFNPFYETTNVLTSFWFGQHHLHQDFLYFHADTLFEPSIFNELIQTPGDVVLPVDTHRCDEEAMKVKLDANGKVTEINKTMAGNAAYGEFIGITKCSGKALEALKQSAEGFMVRKEFHHYFESALQDLVDQNGFDVTTFDLKDQRWNEVDFKEDLERARALFEPS